LIETGSSHTGDFCITVTFYLCEKPGKGEFAFTNYHIIGIFRYFMGTGRSVRAPDNSDALRYRNFMPVMGFIYRVETVTGYIICGFIHQMKHKSFLFTSRREGCK
jgi:hypothetical protein